MLFDRVCSLVIGKEGGSGKELTGLRIAFSIQKGSVKTPNKCSVRVWNAAPETRAVIEAVGNVLILKAGYAEDVGLVTLFAGDVTRSFSVKEGPDWITELELLDGFSEFRDRKVSVSFAAGATTLQVVKDIASRFGLAVRPMPTDVAAKQYKAGFAFVGRCRDAMDKACDYMGLEWSIQNREVQVLKKGGVFKQQAFLLSPDSGLIGSPMQESQTMTEKAAAKLGYTKGQSGTRETYELNREGEFEPMLMVYGYKALSLLQPNMEPGGYVQLQTGAVDGEFFRIEELEHTGDTHGKEWHTDILLRYT
jgi:hypothetical protein